MTELEWINKLSKEKVHDMFSSIDIVLFDIDGVLIRNKTLIPGADLAVDKLRKLGKKIGFVTNNPMYPVDRIAKNLEDFKTDQEEIITPNHSLLAYLKKIDLKKDIYIISSSLPKKLLREAGYNVIEYQDIQTSPLEETVSSVHELSLKALKVCKNVGLVYLDMDFNIGYGAMQAANIIIKHLDGVELLAGCRDMQVPINEKMFFIGPQCYIKGIENLTNKSAIEIAKPSKQLKDVVISKFHISDPSRVLMVGDSVENDIAFGNLAGFKTLLLLSGVCTKEQVEDWKDSEESKPNYVADGLGQIYELIKDMR